MADDDATSALIAQMLAEDYAAAARQTSIYEEDFNSSDEEFDKRRKKKASVKKPRGKAANATRAADPAAAPRTPEPRPADKSVQDSDSPDRGATDAANASTETSATGRKKRKDSGVNRGVPHKAWTEEEERLFVEGLEKFGRDWVAVGHHIGTRDARSVSSHAQKHFIKLFVEGKPLPPKVAESGSGFTLSGKPLDLTSAAFAAYAGSKGRALAAAASSIPNCQVPDRCPGPCELPTACEAEPEAASIPVRVEGVTHVVGQPAEAPKSVAEAVAERKPKNRQPKATAQPKKPKRIREVNVDLAGRTEYSRQRARRASTNPFVKSRDAALEMVSMKKYSGMTGTSKGQPFRVVVAADVVLLADLHAHLSTDEVIGFLGGKWERETSTLRITHVFPGKSVHGDDVSAHVQCEMDPVEEVKIRGVIEASGLSVVGWYHSHPTFEPVPSQCDVDNQCNYQAFFRDHGAAVDPFVGLIVSPFDLRLPSMQSAVAWYHVSSPQTQPCPMVVDADIVFDLPSPPLPISCDGVVLAASLAEPPAPKRLDALLDIVVNCVQHVHGVDPNETWRELGTAVSNAQKLRGSLLSRVHGMGSSWTFDANAMADHAIALLLTEGRGGEEARLFVTNDPRLSTVPEVQFPASLASHGDDDASNEDDESSDGDY